MCSLLSFYFYKEKERLTGKGCVGVVIPWQICRTIGPLLSQRFPLASAKAQPRGGFPTDPDTVSHTVIRAPYVYLVLRCELVL